MKGIIVVMLIALLALYGCGGKTVVDVDQSPDAGEVPSQDAPIQEAPQDDFDLGVDDAGADELDQDIEALDEIDIEEILGEI